MHANVASKSGVIVGVLSAFRLRAAILSDESIDLEYVSILSDKGDLISNADDATPELEIALVAAAAGDLGKASQAGFLAAAAPLGDVFVHSKQSGLRVVGAMSRSAIARSIAGIAYTWWVVAFVAFVVLLVTSRWWSGIIAGLVARQNRDIALIAKSAQEIRTSGGEILSVAERTETHAIDQAAVVDQTKRTMQALMGAAEEIAHGAQSVLESAEKSASASSVVSDRIRALNAHVRGIADVSNKIRKIADKSDTLALNASLEGAKAGETGRGFVLLGAQMRKLAENVTNAVQEIKLLAMDIQAASMAAVAATDEGQKLSQQTQTTSQRITHTTRQQQFSTEQIFESMDDIQQLTRQAVTAAREAKATAHELAGTAEELYAAASRSAVETMNITARTTFS